ncbi:hypothetical protein LA080_013808 [Diaporthe eres]|uniref:Major facilitator superfamily (MFS) profile domain-containing protein n=1 Tax=Diaporthe vaccinii TaxID=105482 RepID=A0ABR4E6F7_9PEZI|nr:hypothetical protein LA080_013808 [Diaporthe eres]
MPDVPHQTGDGASGEDERSPLRSRALPPEDVPPPTFAEGGHQGWLTVLGAFAVEFSMFGHATSYGVYETYYSETLLRNQTLSEIAWIGSIQTWALLSTSIISGPLADQFGLQVILWPGTAVYVLAVLVVSFCTDRGAPFPPEARPSHGAGLGGPPLGGIVFPLLLRKLLHGTDIGFRWSQRIVAVLVLAVLLGCTCFHSKTDAGRRSSPLILLSAFRIPAYTLQVCAMVFLFLGVFTPYVFVAEYGVRHGMPEEMATYMFAIMNAGSLIGRTLGGAASLRLGPFNVMVLAAFLASTSLFSWLGITSTPALVVFAAAYGALSGVLIGIMIATLGHSAPHPSQIATFVGMASAIMGTAALTGTSIAGALITPDGDYSRAILFSATAMIIGALFFLAARISEHEAIDRVRLDASTAGCSIWAWVKKPQTASAFKDVE